MTYKKLFKNPKKYWTNHFKKFNFISYPSEGVIRIFLGKFPKLKKKIYKKNQNILDLGHGDGRHFDLFRSVGLNSYGLEITNEINIKALKLLKKKFINDKKIIEYVKKINFKVGNSQNIPFENQYFNNILLWNSCYYMSDYINPDFSKHVREYARVLKKSGYIIVSIPKKNCFCYKNSKKFKKKYRIIDNKNNPAINGQVLRYFASEREIFIAFKKYFKNFIFSDIDQNWFGLNYKWHIFIAQKKN